MSSILELRGLRKTYGSFVAVDSLDLEIPRGCIYGVLGPNGAGKSTTIRMLMNIYMPDSGSILFDGRPLDRAATDRIAYLPEERGLYKKMKVLDHVIYLAQLKGLDASTAKQRAGEWLERFDLSDRADGKVDELSKGMQQKLQFIGCILADPDMIILDEPFSGLDPINVRLLTEIIHEQKAAGRTVLFSTHVLEQAEKLCDSIFLIHRGHKVLDGPLQEIKSAYPVDTIEVRGAFDAAQIHGIEGVVSANESAGEWKVRLDDGHDPQSLLRALLALGPVEHFSAVRPPLTEIFIREVEASGHSLDVSEKLSAQGVTG